MLTSSERAAKYSMNGKLDTGGKYNQVRKIHKEVMAEMTQLKHFYGKSKISTVKKGVK